MAAKVQSISKPQAGDKYLSVPDEFKKRDQWITYSNAGTKPEPKRPRCADGVPINARDSHNWVSFAQACRALERGAADNIGFVISADDPFLCVDLDHCFDETGSMNPEVAALIHAYPSYIERSTSGRGLHIWYLVEKSATASRNENRSGIEVYNRGKPMMMTGNVLPGNFVDGAHNFNTLQKINESQWKEIHNALGALRRPQSASNGAGGHVAFRENDPSQQSYELIRVVRRGHPEFTIADAGKVEAEIKQRWPEMYEQQRKKHGASWWMRSIRKNFEKEPKAPKPPWKPKAPKAKASKQKANVIEMPAPKHPLLEVATAKEAVKSLARPDMPEAVLDGRLGEICQKRLGRFPIAYAWPAVVTLGAALIPTDEPSTNHGPLFRNRSPFRPTLYTALIGPLGTGKSQAAEQAAAVLGVEAPVFCELKAGSAEGLAPVLDANGAPRVLYPDELGHLLDKAMIQGASFPRVLNSLYYKTREQMVIAKGKNVQFNCQLSIIGGVVEEDFGNVFGPATVHGLYSRMIFGVCPEPWEYLYRPPEERVEETNPTPIIVDSEIWDARDEWVQQYKIDRRVAEHSLRIAYICACFDGRDLKAKDLGPAFEFAKAQMRIRSVFSPTLGPTLDAQCGDRIMQTMTAHGDGWVTVRWLYRKIHAGRYFGAGVFNRCVQNLAYDNELELITEGNSKRVHLGREE